MRSMPFQLKSGHHHHHHHGAVMEGKPPPPPQQQQQQQLPRRLQLRDRGLRRHTLIPRLCIPIPRLRRPCRLPGYSIPRAGFSTCSRRRPGRLTRYSRQGFSTRRRSHPTSPRCHRCRGRASLGQGPCRRRRRGSGSRSPRQGSFLHQGSCRSSAQGGEICSKGAFPQRLPL